MLGRQEKKMIMRCPKCGLLSPADTLRCDCGWDFASSTMKAPYMEPEQAKPLAGIRGWLIPLAIGMLLVAIVGVTFWIMGVAALATP